jgi:hypothetical protein
MSIKVAFIDFWSDYEGVPLKINEITDNDYWNKIKITKKLKVNNEGIGLFHVSYLNKIFNKEIIVVNPYDADLIICSIFGNNKMRYLNKPKICLNFESCDFNLIPNTLYFSSELENKYNYYLPLYICFYGFDFYNVIQNSRKNLTQEEFDNKKLCLSIISNLGGLFRNNFIEKMEYEKLKIDNYGKLYNNSYSEITQNTTWFDPRLSDLIKKYKFMICMENTLKKGYHTEKMMHAYKNGIIPIYWGDNTCMEIFNSNAYLNVNKLGIKKTIEKIKLLSKDLNEYNKMLTEPLIKKNSILFKEEYKKFLYEENFIETIKKFYHSGKSV